MLRRYEVLIDIKQLSRFQFLFYMKQLTQSVQDYLKAIYNLQQNGVVATTDIAHKLEVSSASVTGMLKRLNSIPLKKFPENMDPTGPEAKNLDPINLETEDYVTLNLGDYNSYKGVKLTDDGEIFALEILRRHRLLELYLKNIMGFSLDKVHDEACRLEHYISEDFGDKIYELLGDPKFDPHGHPIPTKDGSIPEIAVLSLAEVESNQLVTIIRLADKDSKLLGYLEELGILPGVQLNVVEKAPFNGPVTIEFAGEQKIIGDEVARSIFVVLD
jgi:DtxR family Mn-dependent transcriptional regulator